MCFGINVCQKWINWSGGTGASALEGKSPWMVSCGAQARSGGQWQALFTYPGKLAIGATFELAADQSRRVASCAIFDDFRIPGFPNPRVMYKNLPSGLMNNKPARFSNRLNYALLHSMGTRQPLLAMATELDLDSDDPANMSVRLAEANCLLDETAREVKHLMSMSEEELDLLQIQEEGAELARRRKTKQVLAAHKLNDELRTSSHCGSGRPAAVQRQPASTPHRVEAHVHFGPPLNAQPSLRHLEFLDHEADGIVRQQVGVRYGFEGSLDRPIPEDYDRISGKRGEKSGLCQVLSENRTLFPQLCPQEFLTLKHVRDLIKFDYLDLRLFTTGELNIIERHDISPLVKRDRTDLLKKILYLAGYYEWERILQF